MHRVPVLPAYPEQAELVARQLPEMVLMAVVVDKVVLPVVVEVK